MKTPSASNQGSRSRSKRSGTTPRDSRSDSAASSEPASTDPKPPSPRTFRILIVDDNHAIHDDFRKILCPGKNGDTAFLAATNNLFEEEKTTKRLPAVKFELDTASQGQEALELVRKALMAGRPYAMAFMDVRMPPGWDGIETTARIWELDPALQVVICTAFSDYSLHDMLLRLGRSDRFVILKKPFDPIEAQQLANACTEKWFLLQELREAQAHLERRVIERTEELAKTQARLAHLLRSSPAIIYSLPAARPHGFSFISQNVVSVLGNSAEELAKQGAWGARLHPDDTAVAADHHAQLLNLGQHRAEYRIRHQDGSYRWLQDEARLHRQAPDQPGEIVGYCIDVTSVKEMEEARMRMEVQLRQAQKLEAVGQLAAGIAHEINTPMQYIGDNIRFLEESFQTLRSLMLSETALLRAAKSNSVTPEAVAAAEKAVAAADTEYLFEEIPTAVKQSLEGVDRVTKIVRAMKEFSHPGTREKAPSDLNRAIESTVTVTRNEWKYIADVKLELDPELPAVPCLVGEFNQCIVNLVVNASHAISDVIKTKPGSKGTITIRTRREGDFAEVRVSDTGTGIPEAIRPRIFEPFFTTKGLGQGTGQGLAIIYASIVRRHGGAVSFETEVGKGTTFILRLPLVPPTTPLPANA